jgi:hypothetical protein
LLVRALSRLATQVDPESAAGAADRRVRGARPADPRPRRLWRLFEAVHAVTYFDVDALAAARQAGYRGFWMGYFAQRAAPLGAVGPRIVQASFYGFHSSRVERALPDAWSFAGPQEALESRLRGMDRALLRLWGKEVVASRDVTEAAALLWQAAHAADTTGRVLAAANQALPRPEEAHLALWQATTTLREHRGDGHIATLVAAGVRPLEAALIKIASGEADGPGLRRGRGWPDEDWRAAESSLLDRGWLRADGSLTRAGHDVHEEIERRTDAAAASPWEALGPRHTERVAELLAPLYDAIVSAKAIPALNPIGVPLGTSPDGADR